MRPLYEPSGRAKEYGDYAVNIYTGCPHRCYYCFAPNVLHGERETFHSIVEPRKGIVEALENQIKNEQLTGKLIHLCFTCDPYPKGYDTSVTRLILEVIRSSGNNVQILTKNGTEAIRDFDLLTKDDWFGVTYSGGVIEDEPNAESWDKRLLSLGIAKSKNINTWVSCEPVLNAENIYSLIENGGYIDKFKIGKLNYYPSNINWAEFGSCCEKLCIKHGRNYYIKQGLREAMQNQKKYV